MATQQQLEAEPYWGREIVTSPMVGLGLQLRVAYGTGAASVGVKGNAAHLSGGHRSQEWIKNSRYCTDTSYATQSGLSGDQLRYCAAIDFTPGAWGSADNRAKMRVLTARMITAMKAGLADEVIEVFGTLDGRTVTGYRNDRNASASSDSSHLDHIHIRFDRRYCNSNAVMSKVAAILLEGDEMDLNDIVHLNTNGGVNYSSPTTTVEGVLASTNLYVLLARNQATAAFAELRSKLDSQSAVIQTLADALKAGGSNLDTAAILARIDSRAAEDAQRDTAHAAEIQALKATVLDLRAQLAAGARAEAAALEAQA